MSECTNIELARRLDKVEARQERFDSEIDILKMNGASSKEQIKTIFISMEEMKGMMKEGFLSINLEIAKLKERPGKNWDIVVASALSAVVTGVIVLIMAKGGL